MVPTNECQIDDFIQSRLDTVNYRYHYEIESYSLPKLQCCVGGAINLNESHLKRS